MTKVLLKTKKEGVTETIPFEIEKLGLLNFAKAMKALNEIVDVLAKNPALAELFEDIFLSEGDSDEGSDRKFLNALVQSAETLLVHLPDQAINLLAVFSGIKREVLEQQAVEDIFDVYDAILEVNDIERLSERAKKSLAATKTKMAFLRKAREATAPAAVAAAK